MPTNGHSVLTAWKVRYRGGPLDGQTVQVLTLTGTQAEPGGRYRVAALNRTVHTATYHWRPDPETPTP